jgi:ribosomal protein S18 acetylase RimI-like enzyme
MSQFSDAELIVRGRGTLVASWETYARGTPGASVLHAPGVAAAIFPHEPERAVYNNALLARQLPAAGRAHALETMAAAYTEAGIPHYAAWVHATDAPMRNDLERRGYTLDTSTRMMGMPLAGLCIPRSAIEFGSLAWGEYVPRFGLPPGLLAAADLSAFHLLVARLDDEPVAAALAFDHEGDCGIYNVETLEHARRRGLGTALTVQQLHDARARGCQTASLQATPMAERLYAAAGFRDLGGILEYVPAGLENGRYRA